MSISRSIFVCIALVLPTSLCPDTKIPLPLTQGQTCAKFSEAVVRIEAGGRSRGTGFIVSSDGLILTAGHVITNQDDGKYFSVITVKLPNGSLEFAEPVTPKSIENAVQDFVVLKVKNQTKLPFLVLGSGEEVAAGADATIIGYPFSAIALQDQHVSVKFCLAASFAAADSETITVPVQSKTLKGVVTINRDVKVDVVYFQGPSVKGISGSPIIARDSGHVVGIVTLKLSGIGPALLDLKNQTEAGMGYGITVAGMSPLKAVHDIITVLDDQLANGLGAATGIDDPKHALIKAQNKTK